VALVESATLATESRSLTTLARLAHSPATRAQGPVLVCVGAVFRDAAHEITIESTQPAANE
jgi:siroheme synthase